MGTPASVEERKVEALPVERGAGEGAAGSPAASKAPTDEFEVKWIRLDFSDLYSLGHIDVLAAELLAQILDAYGVKYELLVNCSPDVGVTYYVYDLEFMRKFDEAQGWQEEEKVIEEYARKKGATAIVELFDGYEWAAAIIVSGEENGI
jgi:hypothetical protein